MARIKPGVVYSSCRSEWLLCLIDQTVDEEMPLPLICVQPGMAIWDMMGLVLWQLSIQGM